MRIFQAARRRLGSIGTPVRRNLAGILGNRSGNFGIIFSLLAVPLLAAVGAGVDFTRAYNIQAKMQTDLDSALLSAVKGLGNKNEATLRADVTKWFKSQSNLKDSFNMKDTDIVINQVTNQITATVTSTVDTTLMQIAGFDTLPVMATSSVQGALDTYYEIHVVMDKSASMLLAATTADQTIMKQLSLNCVFACHDTAYGEWFQGVRYNNYYEFARAKGVKLRSDVQVDAVKAMLDTVETVDPNHNRIKIALYTLGTNTTGNALLQSGYNVGNGIRRIRDLTYNTAQVRTDLSTNTALTSATSYLSSDFRALTKLTDYITANGNGKSAASPYKLVVMVTDGVQSSDYWVFYNQFNIAPANPAWCNTIKNQSVSFAVLYTEYLPWTNRAEYNNTVGNTMGTSRYATTWGGTMPSPNTVKRRDYLPVALKACASQADYFIAADHPDEIKAGLTNIVGTYLGKVRLTQ